MIPSLNQTLAQMLIRDGHFDPREIEVTFDLPGREWSGKLSKPTLNMYLYDLRENTGLRRNEWMRQPAPNGDPNRTQKKKPPARIDLSYMVTAWTSEVEDEHRILWRVLTVLMRYPVLPAGLLQGELKTTLERLGLDVRTSAAQPDGIFKQPGDYWGAIQNQLKPAINYVVTVPLDVEQAQPPAPLVLTRQVRIPADHAEILGIAGTVRSRAGAEAVAGVEVSLAGSSLRAAVTDENGRFRLAPVYAGKQTLLVKAPGKREKQVAVTVPSEEGNNYDIEI